LKRLTRNNTKSLNAEGAGDQRGKASYSLDRSMLITSSEVMTADEFVAFVDYRERDEIVFVEEFRDFVIAGGFVSGDERLGGEREKWRIGMG